MYDTRSMQVGSSGDRSMADLGPKVGGSTLIQQLAPAPAEATPQWEDIDAAEVAAETDLPPLPSPSLAQRSLALSPRAADAEASPLPAPPTDEAHAATSDDDVPVPAGEDHDDERDEAHAAPRALAASRAATAPKDPLGVGTHANAHAAPFERKHEHGDQHHAAVDAYNRGTVHSDKTTAHTLGRPGAVSHGHGMFQVKKDATRYTYTASGGDNLAIPFDVVPKAKLLSINPKAGKTLTKAQQKKLKAEQKAGRNERLALNPSQPRQLKIDDVDTWCVLSWLDGEGGGAAWLPVKNLVGNTHQIKADVKHRADRENPSMKLSPSTRYVIRDDKPGQADNVDKRNDGRVLAPGAHGGINVSHYLEKANKKLEIDPATGKATGKKVDRGFVAICMNLPEGKTPPVAIDTALAGDSFFAFNDKKFHRELAVYENGAKQSHVRQMWVFGHLGRMKGGSGPDAAELEPDPHRAGWVPLRVLRLP